MQNRFTVLTLILCWISCSLLGQSSTEWIPKNYLMEGTWTLAKEGNQTYLVLGEDFRTIEGPDLKLFLSPKDMEEIGKRESIDQSGVLIDLLASHQGAQRYLLPVTDLSRFKSIVVHCQKYSVVWGGIRLKL